MGLGISIVVAGVYIGIVTNGNTRAMTRSQGRLFALVFIVAGAAIALQAAFLPPL